MAPAFRIRHCYFHFLVRNHFRLQSHQPLRAADIRRFRGQSCLELPSFDPVPAISSGREQPMIIKTTVRIKLELLECMYTYLLLILVELVTLAGEALHGYEQVPKCVFETSPVR